MNINQFVVAMVFTLRELFLDRSKLKLRQSGRLHVSSKRLCNQSIISIITHKINHISVKQEKHVG